MFLKIYFERAVWNKIVAVGMNFMSYDKFLKSNFVSYGANKYYLLKLCLGGRLRLMVSSLGYTTTQFDQSEKWLQKLREAKRRRLQVNLFWFSVDIFQLHVIFFWFSAEYLWTNCLPPNFGLQSSEFYPFDGRLVKLIGVDFEFSYLDIAFSSLLALRLCSF